MLTCMCVVGVGVCVFVENGRLKLGNYTSRQDRACHQHNESDSPQGHSNWIETYLYTKAYRYSKNQCVGVGAQVLLTTPSRSGRKNATAAHQNELSTTPVSPVFNFEYSRAVTKALDPLI